jgi:hypothetical protein
MSKGILTTAIFICLFSWSCSKIGTENMDLKQSLDRSVAKINEATDKISQTEGYKLLCVSDAIAKSDEGFNDSIDLESVAGIYDYQPDTLHKHDFYIPYRLFIETGTSNNMIVNLPSRLIFHPKYLYDCHLSDSVLKNNFTITASEYHFYYNWWRSYDYKLNAGFTLDSKDIGSLSMLESSSSFNQHFTSAKYTFTEGYNISVSHEIGDTTISSFALGQNQDTLLKETTVFIRKAYHDFEKQYILSIGNIDIKRSTGVDSIQVFLNGVLQKKAAVKIIDDSNTTGSICHKRDIQLTFDDGTTENLSTLMEPAREILKTLVNSLGEMYFSKHIVDYIAMSIYYHSR